MDNYELEYPSPEQITLPPFTAQSRSHLRQKNKNLRSKKRFTRENKISKVKRDSQPFFLKMPYYKNKFIVKTIHIRMFLYHLFKTLSINFPEFCELAEIESGSVSRFFLVPQYCWSSNQLQLW